MTSGGIPEQAPGARRRWGRLAIACAACALVIAIYAASANSGVMELFEENAAENYYNLLARGFRDGQLNLKSELPPDLSQVASAYDLTAERLSQTPLRHPVWDLSYYKGKLFLYFGVTPALLLFWPYAALTGHYFPHNYAVVLFLAMGFLIGASLLWSLWRRYFEQVGVGVVIAALLALGLANFAPVVLQRCAVNEVAISCGYALTMLSLASVWLALNCPRQAGRWLAMASLACGLAVGARLSLLPGAVMLFAPVLMAWRKPDASDQSDPSAPRAAGEARPFAWRLLLAAIGPIALIGLGLMLYNYLRFDNPLESGQTYQIPVNRDHRQFGFDFCWFNFQVGFLAPARWHAHLPIIGQIVKPAMPKDYSGADSYTFGLLTNVPLVWLALAAPLALLRRPPEAMRVLRCFLVCVAALFAGTAAPLLLHDSMSIRYEFEFAHMLVLLAVIGVLGIERATAEGGVRRLIGRCGWGLLLVFSVGFNLLADVQRHSEARFNLATALMQKGRLGEAEVEFERSLKLDPDFTWAHNGLEILAWAHNNLGMALRSDGQAQAAIAEYRRALSIQPRFREAQQNLANALLSEGQTEEAVTHFRAALEIEPASARPQCDLADVLLRNGQTEEAISHYRRALEIQPGNAQAQNGLGNALLRQNQAREAIAHFQRALEINPAFAEAHYNLGNALLQLGQADAAIVFYQRALSLHLDLAEVHNNLGNALLAQGRRAEAIGQWKQTLVLQPDNADGLNNLAWILATCPDASLRDGTNAVRLARRAVELSGEKVPLFLGTLAAACAEAGRMPEAVAAAERALGLARNQNNGALASALQVQLNLHRAGLPFRDIVQTNAAAGKKN